MFSGDLVCISDYSTVSGHTAHPKQVTGYNETQFKAQLLRMIAYVALFGSALVAATLLPMQSEAVLVGLLLSGEQSIAILLIVATLGNVLGSILNWYLGRFMLRFQDRRWFPASGRQLERASTWYQRYGRWSLLGSWLPIVGDPLTVMAGVLREPFASFLVLVTIAKGARYLVLAAATLAWINPV